MIEVLFQAKTAQDKQKRDVSTNGKEARFSQTSRDHKERYVVVQARRLRNRPQGNQ